MPRINKKYAKTFLFLLKYLPPVTTLGLMVHTLLVVVGINDKVMDNLFKVSPLRSLIMIVASYTFNFCRTHRLFTYYNFIVSVVMMFHLEIGLGRILPYIEFLTMLFGVLIFIHLKVHFDAFLRKGSYPVLD